MEELVKYGISLNHFLILAGLLFTIGMCGIFVNRKNVITILVSIEIMLLSVNINLAAFSVYSQDIVGQVLVMLVMTVAAAESSVGLAILVLYFRNRGNIAIDGVDVMKG